MTVGALTSADRTRAYRERRWEHLEELIRRVIREELRAVENRRSMVDKPVDNVTRVRGRADDENPYSHTSENLRGDEPARPVWTAEDELFPGFTRR